MADSIAESGIRRGVYPGAVLLVGNSRGILHARGFGHLTWNRRSAAPTPDSTLWDLASLTKVMGTTAAVLRLVERGRVDIDQAVRTYLPAFSGGGRDEVTVRMLLNHTSGLRAYLPLYRTAPTRDSAIALLYREPLRRAPGRIAEYSDLNFLLLGLLVERVTGQPLATYVRDSVLAPAGLLHTQYRVADSLAARTAPTNMVRGRAICCRVNDQNAERMGGAAGHAGLFATGTDVASYARMWLGMGTIDGRQVYPRALLKMFLTPDPRIPDRLLGWERPEAGKRDDSAFGLLLSEEAYGHTGWTGTQVWVDPPRDLFLVFLTNRSFAPRVTNSIRALRGIRGALADAVVQTVGR
ncbi:MAG: beta-lactamase family protein [Gemmatimonadetes bacterium]|nr:beta-lactamase family protein [Gemmatimonadota bacterium]